MLNNKTWLKDTLTKKIKTLSVIQMETFTSKVLAFKTNKSNPNLLTLRTWDFLTSKVLAFKTNKSNPNLLTLRTWDFLKKTILYALTINLKNSVIWTRSSVHEMKT